MRKYLLALLLVASLLLGRDVHATGPGLHWLNFYSSSNGSSTDLIQNGNISQSIVTNLFNSVTAGGTGADLTEDILQTYTIPATTLKTGSQVKVHSIGGFAANGDTKTLKFYFCSSPCTANTAPYMVLTATNTSNNIGWAIDAVFDVIGATSETYELAYWTNNTLSAMLLPTPSNNIPLATAAIASAITVKITGTNGTAAANDITALTMYVGLVNNP